MAGDTGGVTSLETIFNMREIFKGPEADRSTQMRIEIGRISPKQMGYDIQDKLTNWKLFGLDRMVAQAVVESLDLGQFDNEAGTNKVTATIERPAPPRGSYILEITIRPVPWKEGGDITTRYNLKTHEHEEVVL